MRRRRWYEMNEAAKAYIERNRKKWESAGRPLYICKLPRGFLCWQTRKDVPIYESFHRALVVALARPKGALEYVMLEMDHYTFRRIPSERALKRKIAAMKAFMEARGW
jgi:hypothetical protein